MKRVKTWGNKSRKEADSQEEAKQRQPPVEARPWGRYITSRGRTAFAQRLHPDLDQMEAGKLVSSDIASQATLRSRMYDMKYRVKAHKYTPEQMAVLLEHYGPTP